VSSDIGKLSIARFLEEFEAENDGKLVLATTGSKGWAESRNNSYWHVKYDSTCGHLGKGLDHGWEIASYVATGHELHSIAKAAEHLHHSGLDTTRNCGLHVHVNARDLTSEQMGLLMARWIKVEPFLIAICNKRRADNKYCGRLLHRYQQRVGNLYDPLRLDDFYVMMRPTNISPHNNSDKKYTLNILGYTIFRQYEFYDRPTVEMRLPECKLSESHVENWTRLFLNFVDFCTLEDWSPPVDLKPATTVEEILKLLGLHGEGQFLLLDDNLLETKKWFLQKLSRSYRMPFEASECLEFISSLS
jgi:hypothetical protein